MTTTANEIELEPFAETRPTDTPLLGSVLPFLGSVKVRVSVRVGGAEMSVTELAALKQGALITLDRLVEELLDVLIDGHVVARGTLVAIGEHFGVRLTDVPVTAPSAVQE